jgi:CheY-like chemotaxis protein
MPPATTDKPGSKDSGTGVPTARALPSPQSTSSIWPTILLAEDDDKDIQLIESAFRNAGLSYQLQVVKDGDQAIQYLQGEGTFSDRAAHPFPVLLLLDLQMPQLNGFEVLQWLKQTSTSTRLLVVVLTGSTRQIDMEKAFQLGANSYLVKSGGYEDLVNFLKSFDLRP